MLLIDRDARANGASIRNFGFVTVTGQERGRVWDLARRSAAVLSVVAMLGLGGLMYWNDQQSGATTQAAGTATNTSSGNTSSNAGSDRERGEGGGDGGEHESEGGGLGGLVDDIAGLVPGLSGNSNSNSTSNSGSSQQSAPAHTNTRGS